LALAVGTSLTPAGAAELAAEAAAAADEEIVVGAFRREYRIDEASTGVGMATKVLDTPLSVTVIPSDLLADQQINNVEDALRNVAAVTRFKQGNGGEEKFSIRGFDASQNLFIDGARLNNAFNATNISSTETANIDRYEVLKGPSAILFGQGLPGGVINYVTKRATVADRFGSAELIAGSDDYYRGELDLNLPLSTSAAVRGVASYQDSQGFRDFDSRERLLLFPTANLAIGERTTFNVNYSYIRDRYTQDRGQILAQQPDGRFVYPANLTRSMFLGIPGFNDRTRSTYQRVAFNLEHRASDALRFELIGAGTHVNKRLFDGSANRVLPDGRIRITAALQGGEASTRYLRGNAELKLGSPDRIENRVLLSASLDVANNDPFFASVRGSGIVIFDPVTRAYTGLDGDFSLDPATIDESSRSRSREVRVSAQDLITISDRVILLAGVGYSRFKDRVGGTVEDSVDPRLGVIYKPTPATSIYASYATGYNPNFAALDANDRPLPGEELDQAEIGVKAELNPNLLLTAALFEINQKGQAVTDPSTIDLPPAQQFSAPLGKTRTRGGELQLIGKLGERLRLIAGYAYLDAELVDDGDDLANDGNRLGGIPKHSGSLFGVYEFDGALEGLGLGGGVFAQSRVPIGFENVSFYDGWAQLDAVATYKVGGWKLQANVKNLTNADYRLTQALAFESLAARRVGVATPRTFLLSVARAF
jgi:iron complex outermembrane recepter protein